MTHPIFAAVNAPDPRANSVSSRAERRTTPCVVLARAAALCGTILAHRTRAPRIHRRRPEWATLPARPCVEQGATGHLLPPPAGRAGMVAPRPRGNGERARGDRPPPPLNAAISALTLMVVAANDHRARRLGLSTDLIGGA